MRISGHCSFYTFFLLGIQPIRNKSANFSNHLRTNSRLVRVICLHSYRR
ncbi:MAG: hypothetical protein E1N59_428, partial [Puniceicoccaceae bacterium 5H]